MTVNHPEDHGIAANQPVDDDVAPEKGATSAWTEVMIPSSAHPRPDSESGEAERDGVDPFSRSVDTLLLPYRICDLVEIVFA